MRPDEGCVVYVAGPAAVFRGGGAIQEPTSRSPPCGKRIPPFGMLQEPHGVTSQKTTSSVTAVKSSNLTQKFAVTREAHSHIISLSVEQLYRREWRLEMLSRVALVRTDAWEELSTSLIRVTRIGELGTTLALTSNRRTLVFLRSVGRLLVTASVVPSSPILATLMK
jgi:hypothetical protein